MIKNYDFHCPYCNAAVNKETKIELTTIRKNGDKGIIRMAAKIGNYTYEHIPNANFEVGELVEFVCPGCEVSLASKDFEHYALLKMKVDQNIEFDVLFSRVAGIHKTYLITEDGIETYVGN